MNDYRCKKCNRLLLKHNPEYGSVEVEVKCPRCREINKVCLSQMLGLNAIGGQPDILNGKLERV